MKKYQYIGSVRTAAGNRLIFPGCFYELPEGDEHVKSLVAKKLLKEVKEDGESVQTEKPKATPKKQNTNK